LALQHFLLLPGAAGGYLAHHEAGGQASKGSSLSLEFKPSIGFVHHGGFMLGWFMGQVMEQGFRRVGCEN
jgi:hypothetical protein